MRFSFLPIRRLAAGSSPGVLRAFVAVALASLWCVSLTAAASPAPSLPGGVLVYLDSDSITPDAPPGGFVQTGYTFWDPVAHAFAPVDGAYALLHPRTGHAAPSEAKIDNNFPGHIIATFDVPKGGPGALEVGVEDGTTRTPVAIAGTGPPPDLPASELVTATIEPIVGDTVVDRAFTVRADVNLRGLWDFDAVKLPDRVVIVARHPGGSELSRADLPAPSQPGTPYIGKLTIPETGDVELAIQVPSASGDVEIEGSTIPRTVIEAGRRDSAAPSAAESVGPVAAPVSAPDQASGIPPIAWIALGVVIVAVLGYLVLRRVADL